MPFPEASLVAVLSALPVLAAGAAMAEPGPLSARDLPAESCPCSCSCGIHCEPIEQVERDDHVELLAEPAESAPAAPTAEHRAYRGLYLSAGSGMGELHVGFADRTISGRSLTVGLEVGVAAASNLVVIGALHDAHLFGPISNDERIASADLLGFGPGLKYYFEPRNTFLSATLLLSQLGRDDEKSYWGTGGRLSVGTEWWVSRVWSLGIAGEIVLARMRRNPDLSGLDRSTYTAKGFSLLLSCGLGYPPGAPAVAEPALATSPSMPPVGYHAHDGFYLGARLGWGWLDVSNRAGSSLSGHGFPFGLAIGFAPRKSLVLFAELYDAPIFRPDSDTLNPYADLDVQGLGPGLRHYLMPLNLFFEATLLVSRIGFHDDSPGNESEGLNATSSWGGTVRLSVGKEWWVSADWGIGLAGGLLFGRTGDYTVKGGSLCLSASFN